LAHRSLAEYGVDRELGNMGIGLGLIGNMTIYVGIWEYVLEYGNVYWNMGIHISYPSHVLRGEVGGWGRVPFSRI